LALALDERQPRQVLAIERQQVEREIHQPTPARPELLQQLEARAAPLVEHDHLAVENRRPGPQLRCRGRDLWEVRRVVRPAAGDDPRFAPRPAPRDEHAHAEAVELELV
jgi:hypothetical protein